VPGKTFADRGPVGERPVKTLDSDTDFPAVTFSESRTARARRDARDGSIGGTQIKLKNIVLAEFSDTVTVRDANARAVCSRVHLF
jgi:hypothetical protein